jgi:hypothetical protein
MRRLLSQGLEVAAMVRAAIKGFQIINPFPGAT